MLSDKEKEFLKEILSLMSENDLKLLAQSITGNMIVPLTTQDAIDVILLHSASSFEVLQHDEIPRQTLFSYLHTKRVSVLKSNKFNMINEILQF
jgi:hypothetical protein